jgi:hypothetical protein
MWLLPFLVVLDQNVLVTMIAGFAVGIAHGGARAVGVLNNRKHLQQEHCSHLIVMGAQFYWRYIDGLVLLLATGALFAYILSLFGIRY